ncbi:MAG: glycosyltransferase family 9 protein [Saprospiraceae bacterium]
MPIRVLVIRFSSIGDLVLTTPVIRALRRQAGAEVHLLTKRSMLPVMAHNPYLERIWTIEKSVNEIAGDLRAQRFDYLIDLHRNLRSLHAKLICFPARSYSFDKLNWKKYLLTRWKIDRLPDVHVVDRYLAAAAPLGVANDGAGLDYFIGPGEGIDPAAAGLPADYAAFVIGAAHATKRLPEAKLVELCRAYRTRPILLLGGPEERELGDRIAAAAGDHVSNACGKYPLNSSADLVRQARVVLTHDTGLMHVAAAFRKPIVSVWGNTVPAFGMTPHLPAGGTDLRMEVKGLACRPCSKIGHEACPLGHFNCMQRQDVEKMVAALDRLGRE